MNDNSNDDPIIDMYGNVDDDNDVSQARRESISVKSIGQLTEIEIANKKVVIVDHNMVKNLDSIVRSMQARIAALEQEVLNLRSRMQRAERNIVSTIAELDTKVSYE